MLKLWAGGETLNIHSDNAILASDHYLTARCFNDVIKLVL